MSLVMLLLLAINTINISCKYPQVMKSLNAAPSISNGSTVCRIQSVTQDEIPVINYSGTCPYSNFYIMRILTGAPAIDSSSGCAGISQY